MKLSVSTIGHSDSIIIIFNQAIIIIDLWTNFTASTCTRQFFGIITFDIYSFHWSKKCLVCLLHILPMLVLVIAFDFFPQKTAFRLVKSEKIAWGPSPSKIVKNNSILNASSSIFNISQFITLFALRNRTTALICNLYSTFLCNLTTNYINKDPNATIKRTQNFANVIGTGLFAYTWFTNAAFWIVLVVYMNLYFPYCIYISLVILLLVLGVL